VVFQKYRKAWALPNEKNSGRPAFVLVLGKPWHIRVMGNLPKTWTGAALAREGPPRDICFGACTTGNLLKQAAPGNVSTRDRFIGAMSGSRNPERHDGTEHRVR
jgi:hypothetical protein